METSGLHAVVGGGIGGAAAALVLARGGSRVLLLERVAEPKAVGAGILLQANGLAVLYGLGLEPYLKERGVVLTEGTIRDGSDKILALARPPDFGEGLDHLLAIQRGDLYTVLFDAVEDEPGIELRLGAEVTDASPEGSLTYRQGGGEHTIEAAALIVGADGVHSVVREHGQFGGRGEASGVRYVRGLTATRPPQFDSVEAWIPLGVFGRAPVGDGAYFFTSVKERVLAEAVRARNLTVFRQAWSRAYPPSQSILEQVERFEDLLINEVIEVHCDHFIDRRLVLLGDAAHAMTPNLGQGANSALVDAAVLAYELNHAEDQAAALQRYDARRRPAVQKVQADSRRVRSAAEMTNPLQRWARDAAIRTLMGDPKRAERAARDVQQEDPLWLLHEVRQVGCETRQ